MYSREILRYSVEELTEELTNQEVLMVERVLRRLNSVYQPTPFITFDRAHLAVINHWQVQPVSEDLRVFTQAFLSLPVFGHTTKTCHRTKKRLHALCLNCGKAKHASV